jgi:hypothetical protein
MYSALQCTHRCLSGLVAGVRFRQKKLPQNRLRRLWHRWTSLPENQFRLRNPAPDLSLARSPDASVAIPLCARTGLYTIFYGTVTSSYATRVRNVGISDHRTAGLCFGPVGKIRSTSEKSTNEFQHPYVYEPSESFAPWISTAELHKRSSSRTVPAPGGIRAHLVLRRPAQPYRRRARRPGLSRDAVFFWQLMPRVMMTEPLMHKRPAFLTYRALAQ